MKKLILFSLVAFCGMTYGQKFIVTSDGLRDANDLEKTFVVLNLEGKTAKQLYDNAIKYINKNYKNPDASIKGKIDGEYLKFNSYKPELLFILNGGVKKVFFDANYTTEMSFKDGKVKYEIIELNMHQINNVSIPLTFIGSGLNWYVFNKKGELKRAETKQDIESYFNSEIKIILLSLKGTNDNW